MKKSATNRCPWAGEDPLYVAYHDREWGTPIHSDRRLFEFLILEGAQAGLSWITVLRKRENYRKAFAGFDPAKVAKFDRRRIKEILKNPGVIRNRLKIESAVSNAKAFLDVQKEFGSFNRYIWQFTDFKTIRNHWKSLRELPSRTPQSEAMSRDLKKRGFRFVGSTICYAFMQAVGMVHDHIKGCSRYGKEIEK